MEKSKRKTIRATNFRQHLFDYLDHVHQGKEPLVIERNGKPEAVVIGFEQYRKAVERKLKPKPDLSVIDAIRTSHEEYLKAHRGRLSSDSVEIIRQIRGES